MTEEQAQKLDDLHRFFMMPRAPGKKTRAEELDDLLAGVRTGRSAGRAVLWVAGFVVAVAAAWGTLKGWMK